MNSLVSVIITTHKRDVTILKRAIDSVYSQTYKEFEIIVVDDAIDFNQHEKILKLIDSYDARITYLENNIRPSACVSRNIGIRASKGEYIALLDDDDEWGKDKLQCMLPLFTDDVALVYSNFQINNNGKIHQFDKSGLEGDVFEELLIKGNFIGGCSVPVMTRDSVLEVGLFDENLKSAQDYDLWLRISKLYKVKYYSGSCINYYISNDAISSSPKRKLESTEYLLEKYKEEFECTPKAKDRILWDLVYCLYLNGNIIEARNVKKRYYGKSDSFKSLVLFIKSIVKRLLLWTSLQNR